MDRKQFMKEYNKLKELPLKERFDKKLELLNIYQETKVKQGVNNG